MKERWGDNIRERVRDYEREESGMVAMKRNEEEDAGERREGGRMKWK